MNSQTRLLPVALALAALCVAGCGTTVKPGQMGLVWHPIGRGLDRESVREGYYWQILFIPPCNDDFGVRGRASVLLDGSHESACAPAQEHKPNSNGSATSGDDVVRMSGLR